MNTRSIICMSAASALICAMLIGCQSTFEERSVKPSGFLKNTSQLKEGTDDQALLVYIDKSVHFAKYTKVMLEPVMGYGTGKRGSITKLNVEDQKKLLNYFDAALRREIGKSYHLVNHPGPDVMKIRVAVTEAKGAKILLDTISSVIPIGIALSAIKAIATGKHMSIGEIGAEFEVLDSQSGERLAAAIDSRAGRKYTLKFDKFKKWRTADDAFDYWAERIHLRLTELARIDSKNQ